MPTPGERFDRAEGTAPYKPQSRALDPLDVVIADGWNVRIMDTAETREHIAALKLAILTNGYDQTKPISVKYDRISGISTLVDGQCRLTACQEIRLDGTEIWIPAIVTDGDEAQLLIESMAGNSGKNLTQWEIGEGCRRLTRMGKSVADIAASICKTKKFVTEAIALSNVSLEAKSMMAAHQVTPARVLQEVKTHGEKAVEVLKEAIAKHIPEPEPHRERIPGTSGRKPSPVNPLARSKSPSASEKVLELADDLAAKALDDELPISEVCKAAKAYQKARGI